MTVQCSSPAGGINHHWYWMPVLASAVAVLRSAALLASAYARAVRELMRIGITPNSKKPHARSPTHPTSWKSLGGRGPIMAEWEEHPATSNSKPQAAVPGANQGRARIEAARSQAMAP
jgi:hypothetical protein